MEDDPSAESIAIIYIMRLTHANQVEDTNIAKSILESQLGIRNVKIVDLAAQFAKRMEVERATAGRKHYPIIYLNQELIGVRFFFFFCLSMSFFSDVGS
jgi:hypothetical protein